VNVNASVGAPTGLTQFSAENGENMFVGSQDGTHQLFIQGHVPSVSVPESFCLTNACLQAPAAKCEEGQISVDGKCQAQDKPKEDEKPSCFTEFLKNWGKGLAPWPIEDNPGPGESGRLIAEGVAGFLDWRAVSHATERALTVPFRSSIIRTLVKGSAAAEELAAFPIFTMGAGLWAYREDFIHRREGECKPFSWEGSLP
jgi:hypothetical protein